MSTRINRLKEKLFLDDDRGIFLERMDLLEEAYAKYHDGSYNMLYARAFNHVLRHMSVVIQSDELIVGGVMEVVPNEELERRFLEVAQSDKFTSLEFFTFDPLGLIPIKDVGLKYTPSWFNSWGHMTMDWMELLQFGFQGIAQKAQNRLEQLPKDYNRQCEFLMSVLLVCEAVSTLARRYELEARNMAEAETDPVRCEEFLQIARNCSNVPVGPASSFYEALQSVWFVNLILHCVCGARDYGLGRFDQYLYSYYCADLAAGRLDRERALELVKCFFIKQNEIIGFGVENYTPKRVLSVNSLQYIIIGGSDAEGCDMTNELSDLVLDAVSELALKQPTVVVRYHRNMDRNIFLKSCRIAKNGLGYPSYYNDDVVVAALKNLGVSTEEAVDYVHYGCLNTNLPGKEDELREAWHNLAKYLEFALNEGRCLITGFRLGARTKPVKDIRSFDDLLDTLRIQIRHGIQLAVNKVEESDRVWHSLKPFSFESVLLRDCIERAEDLTGNGVIYKHMNNHAAGIATVANALLSIKQLVFDETRYTLKELNDILKANYRGYENLRREIINCFPKYGNDDDNVDTVAVQVGEIFCREVLSASSVPGSGRKLWPTFYSLWHHRDMGRKTAATADGRLACEHISESQSPVYDTEKYGPTAAFNSVAKLPFRYTPGGGINVKLHPAFLHGDKGTQILAGLLEGYFFQGGLQMQLNVIKKADLLDAKKNPDKHKNLLVRIVGYSAYFVTLSPEQQDEIIARSEL